MENLFSVIIGAFIGYAIKAIDEIRSNRSRAKCYKELLILDFEKNITMLKSQDFTENPFSAVKHKFWNTHAFNLVSLIPKDAALYGRWLSKCKSFEQSIENFASIDEVKKEIISTSNEGAKILHLIQTRAPQ